MRFKPVIQAATVVMVGNFNPAIITPAWLRLNDIIGDEELAGAQVGVIHPEISDFAVDPYRILVQKLQFQIETAEEPFVRIADIISGLFGRLLPHTPIKMMGINFAIHFNLDSRKQQHALGRRMAPVEPWGEWGARLESSDMQSQGGLRVLTMEEPILVDRLPGSYRRVQIEPSVNPLLQPGSGIHMNVNDHFQFSTEGDPAEMIAQLLVDKFDSSIAQSKAIVAGVMDLAASL